MGLDEIKKTSIEEVKQHFRDRNLNPTIPPEHIVTGECSWEALTHYLMQHPMDTLRAREVILMCKWMQPTTANMWDLGDILKPGDKPGE